MARALRLLFAAYAVIAVSFGAASPALAMPVARSAAARITSPAEPARTARPAPPAGNAATPAKAIPPGSLSIIIHKQVVAVAPHAAEAKAVVSSPHVALGVPKVKATAAASIDVLMDKGYYVVSYNPTTNEANWVSWHLDKHSLSSGAATRENDFRGDDELPTNFYHVVPHDYLHSGYDMGHLVPSKDRSRSPSQNQATFLMTNMTPQRPELNRGPWKYLEDYERKLVSNKDKELDIIAGPIFSDRPKTIGKGVTVASAYYKIAVIRDKGEWRVNEKTEIIAVIMPNSTAVKDRKWTDYIVTPKEIEEATGREFFTSVPADVRAALVGKKADITIASLGAAPQ